jgi:hypothetical protein
MENNELNITVAEDVDRLPVISLMLKDAIDAITAIQVFETRKDGNDLDSLIARTNGSRTKNVSDELGEQVKIAGQEVILKVLNEYSNFLDQTDE